LIIVGAYPKSFASSGSQSPISFLSEFVEGILPRNVALHLLPFYPCSGDAGFAVDDWYAVSPDLGTWDEIRSIARARRLVVDGVYNHIGLGHKWFKQFIQSPDSIAHLLHVYSADTIDHGPLSPRGKRLLNRIEVSGRVWHLWQTFTEHAVDIRLDSPLVQTEVENHLRALARVGVWGVRLDAVAYYSKELGQQVRHHHGAYSIAESIADKVERNGMRVIAQVDCDPSGVRYFKGTKHETSCVLNDYSYSIYLTLSILTHDPTPLAHHLERMRAIRRPCLRTPRNHDGFLFRSGLLQPRDVARLAEVFARHGVAPRTIEGELYEFNCSAPFAYALENTGGEVADWIDLAVAITAFSSPYSYYYLPFLMGFVPEELDDLSEGDPRMLNRREVPNETARAFIDGGGSARVRELLDRLAYVHDESANSLELSCSRPSLRGEHVLSLTMPDEKFELVANFSAKERVTLTQPRGGSLVYANSFEEDALRPGGFVIWRLT
jgi:glycosidase